jgi:hypothetical protein
MSSKAWRVFRDMYIFMVPNPTGKHFPCQPNFVDKRFPIPVGCFQPHRSLSLRRAIRALHGSHATVDAAFIGATRADRESREARRMREGAEWQTKWADAAHASVIRVNGLDPASRKGRRPLNGRCNGLGIAYRTQPRLVPRKFAPHPVPKRETTERGRGRAVRAPRQNPPAAQ